MATIAQGQLAGQLAANLTALAAFMAAVQNAQTAGQTVASLTFQIGGAVTMLPLMPNDSPAILAALLNEAQKLQASWTGALAAI